MTPRSLVLVLMLVAPAWAENSVDFSGRVIQGGLVIGKAPPGSQVVFEGRPIQVSAAGDFLIGFGRNAAPTASVAITYPDGRKEEKTLTVHKRDYQVQRIDGLPPRKVSPTAEDLKRIRKEQALIDAARRRNDARTDFVEGFVWPVTGRVSGVYGSQRILNGQARRPHYGVDVAAPTGTKVHAPADGLVSLTHPDMYFSGGTVMLDHGHGLTTMYMHLSKLHVHNGQHVKQGQLIAEVGATGRVTGPHLHWAMNLFRRRLDPALLVAPMPQAKKPE